jgi:hypothetical protein
MENRSVRLGDRIIGNSICATEDDEELVSLVKSHPTAGDSSVWNNLWSAKNASLFALHLSFNNQDLY